MASIAILSFYSGVVERGVETFAYEIASRLSPKNKITVFQAGHSRPQKFKVREIKMFASKPKSQKGLLGKIYVDLQSIKILLFTLLALPRIFKGKFDVIIPLNGSWQTVIIRILSKLSSSKVLISGHAGIGSDDAWNLLFKPDIFIALTNEEEKWAKKLAPEVKTSLIYNGVDLSRFNPKIKPRNISLKHPIVICVAALVPYKRVDLTIRAVAQTGMSLLVIGDGELKGSIDSLGKRLLGERYLRFVSPYAEIPGYYRAADVFSIASKTEAFGIAYAEAMACNLPVVTTHDKSRAEIVGRAGILTDPENIKMYAKDLKLAEKTNYKNIPYGQSLKYSWNNVAQKYQKIIDVLEKTK